MKTIPAPVDFSPVTKRRVAPATALTRTADRRPGVAASGAMVRVRGNAPEFHKVAAAGARHIHGGLVSKRRAGK